MSLPVSGLDCPQNKLMLVPSDIIHPAQVQLPKSSKPVPKAAFNLSILSVQLRRGGLDLCVSLSLAGWHLGCAMGTQCSPPCSLNQLLLFRAETRRGHRLWELSWHWGADSFHQPNPVALSHDKEGQKEAWKYLSCAQKGPEWACWSSPVRWALHSKQLRDEATLNKGLWCLSKPLGQWWINAYRYTQMSSSVICLQN